MTQDFHAFKVRSNKGRLTSLPSVCHACAAFDPTSTPTTQRPQFQKFQAIWDTGATNSVISQHVVDTCGLRPTGMTQVAGVFKTQNAETFLVNIRLPNAVGFANVKVTLGNLVGTDMLIGMDIITLGDFAITNVGGNTLFTFRVPSIATIDYVKEADAVKAKAQRSAKRRRRPATKKRHGRR